MRIAFVVVLAFFAACSPPVDGSDSGHDPANLDSGMAATDAGELDGGAGIPADGTLGGACYGNGTCNARLLCFVDVCVHQPPCGNGEPDDGEQCDNGAANSQTAPDACRLDCTLARCGDGVRDSEEACDGNAVANGACTGCRIACDTTHDDCDGEPTNGCEADLTTDANCGRCGNVCRFGACSGGECPAELLLVAEAPAIHSLALLGGKLHWVATLVGESAPALRRFDPVTEQTTVGPMTPNAATSIRFAREGSTLFALEGRRLHELAEGASSFAQVARDIDAVEAIGVSNGAVYFWHPPPISGGPAGTRIDIATGTGAPWGPTMDVFAAMFVTAAMTETGVWFNVRQPPFDSLPAAGFYSLGFAPDAAAVRLRDPVESRFAVLGATVYDEISGTIQSAPIDDTTEPTTLISGLASINGLYPTPTCVLFTNALNEVRRTDLTPGNDATTLVTTISSGDKLFVIPPYLYAKRSEPVEGVARDTIRRYRYDP